VEITFAEQLFERRAGGGLKPCVDRPGARRLDNVGFGPTPKTKTMIAPYKDRHFDFD
jgi:hypothetical protein